MTTTNVRRAAAIMLGAALATAVATQSPPSTSEHSTQDKQKSKDRKAAANEKLAPVPIHFRGRLPGSVDPKLSGVFRVDFRIYRSPQGGAPIWHEAREVRVTKGVMSLDLGTVTPVPMSIHTTTFKWLGTSVNGGPEVYPRAAIVNVVYASPKEALLAVAAEAPRKPQATAVTKKPSTQLSDRNELATTWIEALRKARAAGVDLPSHTAWFDDLAHCEAKTVSQRAGHYEWVLPWVYDTASHGSYNRYFRGRFQGCDYMDLSPDRKYTYRIPRKRTKSKGASR